MIPRSEAVSAQRWKPGKFGQPVPVPPPKEKAAEAPAPEPVAEAPAPPVPPAEAVAPATEPSPSLEVLHRDELEALREAARREGYSAGHAEGFERGKEQAEALRVLLTSLGEVAEDLEQGIARDVLSLSLEIAKQIVRQSLRAKPDLILAVIREAAKSLPELGDGARLVLHPEDAELVRLSMQEDDSFGPWMVTEDPKMERGSCKFQSATTEVDATLETRWRRVVTSLGRDDAWLDLNL